MKSILLKVMLAVVGVAISVNASAYDFEVDGIYYKIVSVVDRTCKVTYKGESSDTPTYSGVVTIPETVIYNTQTVKVIGIDMLAFYNNDLEEINLPSTLTTIEFGAFWGCSKLKEINLPQSLESIGLASFDECVSLKRIEIPSSVIQIKGPFYQGCLNLESIIFPLDSPFEWIDKSIVNKNDSILIVGNESGKIPNNVKAIGESAFSNGSFSEVTIPKNIQSIGASAYLSCRNLSIVKIEDSNQPINVNTNIFANCPLDDVYVGRNLEYYECAFDSSSPFMDSNIKNVTLGESVTKIPTSLFMRCYSLQKCEILGCIESVGSYAFYNCKNLIEFPFTDSNCTIDCIEEGTFMYCKGLNKIIFPQTITSLKYNGFGSCGKIDYLYINPALKNLNAIDVFDDCVIDTIRIEDSENPFGLSAYNVPIRAFYLGRKTSLYTWDSKYISYIRYGDVFETAENLNNDESLKTIDLGVNVNQIDYKTFSYCSGLTSIVSRNPIPPANAIFPNSVYLNAVVKVPKGSLEAYQADANWRNFWNISEMDFSDVENVTDDAQAEVDVYNLQGVRVRKEVKRSEATQGLPQGIYIINGEKFLVK